MFGGNHPSSGLRSLQSIATIPEFLWELFLGVYCVVWGFRTDAPVLSEHGIPSAPAGAPILAGSAS